MFTPQQAALLLDSFDHPADPAAGKSRDLTLQLLQFTPAPLSRYQFTPGHLTATGLVLAPGGERLLLVHHRRLDRWLLPGGHVEEIDGEPWHAARREVIEETGAVLAGDAAAPLIGVDVHGIPPRKSEPYHLHHDLVFFFRAQSDEFIVSEESRAIAWATPDEFDSYRLPANLRIAYRRALTTMPK